MFDGDYINKSLKWEKHEKLDKNRLKEEIY